MAGNWIDVSTLGSPYEVQYNWESYGTTHYPYRWRLRSMPPIEDCFRGGKATPELTPEREWSYGNKRPEYQAPGQGTGE